MKRAARVTRKNGMPGPAISMRPSATSAALIRSRLAKCF